jgi:hypothetical protein
MAKRKSPAEKAGFSKKERDALKERHAAFKKARKEGTLKKKPKTRAEKMKADRAARKKHFDETKKAQARKGQQGMTLKQRQADDDRIGREKLIKKNSKSDADYEKKKKRMIKDVDKRHGTNKDNLKAIKAKNRPGQATAIVKHQAGNVVNKVKGFFKRNKKKK